MDIVAAVLQEVRATLGDDALTEEIAQQIEKKVRAMHGGKVVHVSVATQEEQINRIREKARRNHAIRRAIQEGCAPAELRERFGLSRSQIYSLAKDGY